MLTALKDGDYTIAENLTQRLFAPKVGEIVVFKELNSGKKMVKRIIFKTTGGYFVKSDNIGWGGFIHRKDILGRIILL